MKRSTEPQTTSSGGPKLTIGIHDVAKAAGVSPSTVSNVLNGRDHRMRPETKKRVLETIGHLGYQPSAIARQFRTGQSRAIGLVVPSVANPFWGAVAHQVERAATALGYRVLFCNAERDVEAEKSYAETLLASGIRGIILGSSPLSFEPFADLAQRGMVIAAFDHSPPYAEAVVACSTSVDNRLAGRLATQHLIGLGHQRIGFISGPIRTASRIARLQGMSDALAKAGLELDRNLLWQGPGVHGYGDAEGPELGRIAVREMLSVDSPPTAIMTINDMYALGCLAGARDLGFSVPKDLSLVGFDDLKLAEIANPPLTTIRQPLEPMVKSLVKALVTRLEANTDEPKHHQIAPELVVRASTTGPRS